MKQFNYWKTLSISSTYGWLLLFALIPLLLVFTTSFLQQYPAHLTQLAFTLKHYQTITNPLYIKIFLRSLYIALIVTLICLLIAYPFSYWLARCEKRYKAILLSLIIIPFWTSSLIRTYAMIAILKANGIINSTLQWLGIIDAPLQLLYSNTAIIIGLVYNFLPFMILPLVTSIEQIDRQVIEAAYDLGASKTRVFFKVILPLNLSSIIAGSILVMLPTTTLFFIPAILGGAKSLLLGNLIYHQFFVTENWPLGAAISTILTAIILLLLFVYWRSLKTYQR